MFELSYLSTDFPWRMQGLGVEAEAEAIPAKYFSVLHILPKMPKMLVLPRLKLKI